MKTRILTTITTATLVMSTMLPTFAAHIAKTSNPTAAQVTQGLMNVYTTQQVWPKGMLTPQVGQSAPYWANGATPSNPSQWIGLVTVFPGQPASAWATDLGMTNAPTSQPISAGTLAQWLLNWQEDARHVKLLQYQPSQSAYVLMQDYSYFYGTDFKSASSMVTNSDLAKVEQNIVEVDQGYRILAPNKVELLMPMLTHSMPQSTNAKQWFTQQNWGLKGIGPLVNGFDTITFTFLPNGNVVYNRTVQGQVRYFLSDVFVKNNHVTGEDVTMTASVAPAIQWMNSHPVPRTLLWNKGEYIGASYSGIGNSVPDIKNNFLVVTFRPNYRYVAVSGYLANVIPAPDYVISSNGGQIQKIEIYNDQNYPEFCLQMGATSA